MRKMIFKATALAGMLAVSPLFADDASFTTNQQDAIEKIVHDYLLKNPEILIEASQVLQQKQQQVMQKQVQSAISENAAQIFNDTMGIAGNPKGSVTVVEFFDYQCIHCKKMSPVMNNLVASDKNVRVIYKEFPIFGAGSDFASKAALAASMQGKYQVLHDALFKANQKLDEKSVMIIARDAGLNLYKLKTDMQSKAVKDALDANRALAEKLHLMGTPAFIVAETPDGMYKAGGKEPVFVPGSIGEDALKEMIQKMQKAS